MAGSLTSEEIAEWKDCFSIFDKNNDGFINYPEVKDMLISMGHDACEWRVKEIINMVDSDGDGAISFPEFLNLMAKNKSVQEEGGSEIEQMFKLFDRDGDGYVTHEEIKRALREMGDDVLDSEVDGMMKEADVDGDGKVTFAEFEIIMKKTHPDNNN